MSDEILVSLVAADEIVIFDDAGHEEILLSADGVIILPDGNSSGITLPIAQSDVTGLPAALSALSATDAAQQISIDDKADALHGHAIADVLGLAVALTQVETNRLAILTKADTSAVAQQIADLVGTDQQILTAIQEIGAALADDQDLLDALEYTVANRVRFDTAAQALTSLQKANARTNISAEELGTAALLIAQITAASIGLSNVPNVDARSRSTHTGTQPANTVTGLATVATSGSYNDLSDTPSGQYTRLFSRGRAALDRLLFTTFSPAQKLHNGFLTVPAEYNVVGGVCLFEFDLYTATIASQSGSFRIFLNESNVVSGGATNLGSNSLDGQALSCQFTFLRSSATHVVVALRVNGSLIAKQRLTGPSAPTIGTNADYSIRWQSTANEVSLEYVESIFTAGYGNKP